jgi:hypothetical protein
MIQPTNRARCAPARPHPHVPTRPAHPIDRSHTARPTQRIPPARLTPRRPPACLFNPAPPALMPPPPPSWPIDPVLPARPLTAHLTSRHCILHPTPPSLTSASSCSASRRPATGECPCLLRPTPLPLAPLPPSTLCLTKWLRKLQNG